MKEKVIVGMSGGVDSSVAAYLLKEQGYEVIGVTMTLWRENAEDSGAFLDSSVEDARRVAEHLGIRHETRDFGEEFRRRVVDRFAEDYAAGRTPNPCILCNQYLKWGALLNYARSLGADRIATGHYARIRQLPNGRYTVERAAADNKDQTYVLYRLTQDQLAHTLMPVGDYDKEEVRRIAASVDARVAGKRDSQEICFIPDNDHGGFLRRYLRDRFPGPGSFVTPEGKVLGTHGGLVNYTIGQRKGLGIAAGHPVFVTALRPERNEVVIGESEDLFSRELTAREVNFMGLPSLPPEGLRAVCRIRYAHRGAACTVYPDTEEGFRVVFDEPQRAITPGQSAVVCEKDHILLGGIIQ